MKRFLIVALMAVVAFSLAFFVYAEEVRPVYVTLNGEIVDCASYGQEATIVDGRTMVPLRAIFEALGATVEWEQETKTVTSVLDKTEIKLTIGENVLLKNGEEIQLDVPALIMNGRTLVPVRAISEAFGVYVEWDSETRTVLLTAAYKEYVRGVVEGNTYVGEWTGLVYETPEGVVFLTDEQINEMTESTENLISDSETGEMVMDYAMSNIVYEFMALDALGNNVQLVVEKNVHNLTAYEYVSHVKDGFELIGYDYEESVIYTAELGGYTFICIDIEIEIQGSKLEQSTAVRSLGDRFIVMTLTDVKDGMYILEGFINLSEYEKNQAETEKLYYESFEDISSSNVPAEALEVVNAYFAASQKSNYKEALKYCVNADEYKDLEISDTVEMLEYAGINKKTITQVMMADIPEESEEYEATEMFFGAIADVVLEFIPKINERADFTVDSARIEDQNKIQFLVTTYTPSVNVDSEKITVYMESALTAAILEGRITEDMSEAEIYAEISGDFADILGETLREMLETEDLEPNGTQTVTAVKTENGKWLVEISDEEISVLESIKNSNFLTDGILDGMLN